MHISSNVNMLVFTFLHDCNCNKQPIAWMLQIKKWISSLCLQIWVIKVIFITGNDNGKQNKPNLQEIANYNEKQINFGFGFYQQKAAKKWQIRWKANYLLKLRCSSYKKLWEQKYYGHLKVKN